MPSPRNLRQQQYLAAAGYDILSTHHASRKRVRMYAHLMRLLKNKRSNGASCAHLFLRFMPGQKNQTPNGIVVIARVKYPSPRSSAPSATHAVRHKIDRAFLQQGKWACERKKLNAQHQEHQRAFPPPCGSINAEVVKRPRPSAIPWVKGAEAFRNRAKFGERKPILAPQVLPRPSSGLLLLTPPPNE